MVIADSFACYPNGQAYADSGIAAVVREAGDMRAFAGLRAAKLGLPPERAAITVEQMACKSVPCYLASTQATWTGDYRDVLPTIRRSGAGTLRRTRPRNAARTVGRNSPRHPRRDVRHRRTRGPRLQRRQSRSRFNALHEAVFIE